MQKGDQIIAFFPCTRFEDQIVLGFTGNSYGQKDWDDKRKLEYDLKLHNELHELYCLITKLVLVCISRSIPLIIENPKGTMHYLTRYWCLNPSVIDNNRKERGDLFKKPTQYWFINRKPSNHLIIEPIKMNESCSLEFITKADWQYNDKIKNRKVARSMIHPDYANRFIREFII